MKPMLAATLEDMTALESMFPVIVQPKLDGIRALIVDGIVMSRTLKPIPNRYIQAKLMGLGNFDGELIVGNPNDTDVFNKTMEGVMSRDGKPDFTYVVFDSWDRQDSYTKWEMDAQHRQKLVFDDRAHCQLIKSESVSSLDEYLTAEEHFVSLGYEGIMIRGWESKYKFGRSTVKEGHLLKAKRFYDAEAIVIGLEELMRNQNEKITNALGQAERSTKKDGLVPGGMLGRLICRMPNGHEFGIGSGFDVATRKMIWENPLSHVGKVVTYKFQGIGSQGSPRFPVFKGFRDPIDVGSPPRSVEELIG